MTFGPYYLGVIVFPNTLYFDEILIRGNENFLFSQIRGRREGIVNKCALA